MLLRSIRAAREQKRNQPPTLDGSQERVALVALEATGSEGEVDQRLGGIPEQLLA